MNEFGATFAPYVWHVTNGITTVNGVAPTGHIRIIVRSQRTQTIGRVGRCQEITGPDSRARMRENTQGKKG